MTVAEEIRKLSSAEDIFAYFDVPYDAAVLDRARLHILRRMGDTLRKIPSASEGEELRAHMRQHLVKAYQDFVHSSPLDERVFKVLQDAVREKRPQMVSLTVPGQRVRNDY